MATLPTSASTSEAKRPRYDVLDLWRGLAVVCMVIWHLLWDLEDFGWIPWRTAENMPWELLRAGAVHSFLFLAGVSCALSRDNRRRCGKLAAAALLVSLAMGMVGQPVLFGILHLLCVCVAMYILLERPIRRASPLVGAAVCLLAFAALFPWLPQVRVTVKWLWWLGLRTKEFYSADYYPLLPWGLLFFAGAFAGREFCERLPVWKLHPALTWTGRHALGVYLLHQPLMLAVLTGIQYGMK